MMKMISRSCNLCNTLMHGGIVGFVAHGEEHHPDYYLTGTKSVGLVAYKFVEKKYWCPLDNEWYSSRKYLARTLRAFNMTNEQYFLKYGEQYMPEDWKLVNEDEKYGDSAATPTCLECEKPVKFQEQKWQYPRFCGFSCSAKWHAVNTDRVEMAMETNRQRKAENPDHQLGPMHIKYWINKGYTEEEAEAAVKKRQNTNSLENFTKLYGEEEGANRFQERQNRWHASMVKSGMFGGYSKVSNELFTRISEQVDVVYGSEETSIRCGDKVYWVDCIQKDKNKIIEFYGDFWHGNPNRFKADDIVFKNSNKTAGMLWEKDKNRVKLLEEAGYEVMVIWECEYRDNPDLVVGKCLGFLSAK